jgi:YbbR domain-containing protein
MNLRRVLFDNLGIKLLSLTFSLTLWLYVTSMGKTEQTLIVPLELRNIPRSMTVVGNVTANVEVRAQGQERLLRDAAAGKKIVALLDLSMTKEGENIVRISPYDIRRPVGIAITHMSLSEVKVKLEPLARKTIKLTPVLFGRPEGGYRLAGVTVTPAKIMIEGPVSVIKTLHKLETMPIDIQEAKNSMIVEPKIDCQGQQVKLLEKNIIVQITIERTQK